MDIKSKKAIIGTLIKKEREKQGLSQDKLSALIGIDPTNLSKIERGISFPSFKNFCNIIEVLKVEPNAFLSFVHYEKNSKVSKEKELLEHLKILSDESKDKLIEFILTLGK